MATDYHLSVVQQIIQYKFKCKDLLKLALTAAEKGQSDGNRKLAKVGQAALQLIIADRGYEASETRDVLHTIQAFIDHKERLAEAAKLTGIEGCIKRSQMPGSASATVMRLAMRAIIGAAWKDSKSFEVVLDIFHRFSLPFETVPSHCQQTIDPLKTLHNYSDSTLGLQPNKDLGIYMPHSTDISTTASMDARISSDKPSTSYSSVSMSDDSIVNYDSWSRNRSLVPEGTIESSVHAMGTPCNDRPDSGSHTTSVGHTKARAPKRPKVQQISINVQGMEWLNSYIADEAELCSQLGLPGPRLTFLDDNTMKNLSDLTGRMGDVPVKIAAGICSASSIIALRGAIQILRNEPSSYSRSLHDIPAPERLAAIEVADQQIASLTLLKRCHVLRLWEEHCNPERSSGFIIYGGPHGSPPKRAGNPRNIEKNKMTKLLLKRMCPNLEEDSNDYAYMHEKAKILEKLGRRLHKLSCRYGLGILGLLQCSEHRPNTRAFLEVTDQMLLKPTDADFEQLLGVLDRSQGEQMRDFGKAAIPIVKCVLEGTLKSTNLFLFEQVECSRIARLPKGSLDLLSLLTGGHLYHLAQQMPDTNHLQS